MKSQIFLAVILVATLIGGRAFATDLVSFDGLWWQSHNAAERILFVEGEIDGLRTACVHSAYVVAYAQAQHNQAKFARLSHEKLRLCQYSHKFGVYENDVTNFYLDHPKEINASIGSILSCYGDYDQTHGRPEKCAKAWGNLFR